MTNPVSGPRSEAAPSNLGEMNRFHLTIDRLLRREEDETRAAESPVHELTYHTLGVLARGLERAVTDPLACDRLFEVYANAPPAPATDPLPHGLAERIRLGGFEALRPSELVRVAVRPLWLIVLAERLRSDAEIEDRSVGLAVETPPRWEDNSVRQPPPKVADVQTLLNQSSGRGGSVIGGSEPDIASPHERCRQEVRSALAAVGQRIVDCRLLANGVRDRLSGPEALSLAAERGLLLRIAESLRETLASRPAPVVPEEGPSEADTALFLETRADAAPFSGRMDLGDRRTACVAEAAHDLRAFGADPADVYLLRHFAGRTLSELARFEGQSEKCVAAVLAAAERIVAAAVPDLLALAVADAGTDGGRTEPPAAVSGCSVGAFA